MRALFTLLLSVFSFSLLAQFDWQHTNGPQGFPYGIYSPVTTDNDFYVGTGRLIYRMNADETWSKIENGVSFTLAAYDNKLLRRNYVYSEAEQSYTSVFSISLDFGSTFQQISTPPLNATFPSYKIAEAGIFMKADDDTPLHFSSDNGNSFTELDLSFLPSPETQFTFSFDGDYFLTHESGGLWKYNEVGSDFIEINIPTGSNINRNAWYVDGTSIFFFENDALWTSNDYGATWGSTFIDVEEGIEQIIISGDYLYLKVDPFILLYSNDMGQTWTSYEDYSHYFSRLYALNDKLYIADTDYGINSFNPINQSFTILNEGTEATFPVQMQSRSNKIWTSTLGGIYSYDLSLGEWEIGEGLYHTDKHYEHVVFGENDIMYATKWLTDTIYTSLNGGEDWTKFNMNDVAGFDWWGPVGRVSTFGNVLYVEEDFGSLYKSENGGESFYMTDALEDNLRHSAVEINGIYVSAYYQNVYRSIDGGNTWTAVFYAENNSFFYAGVEKTDTRFFVVLNGKLYSSPDGLEWKYSHDGFVQNAELMDEDLPFEDSERIWEHEDIFYYKTKGNSHLYTSNDTCKTWVPVAENGMFKMTMSDEGIFYGGYYGVSMSEIPRGYGELVRGVVYLDINNNGIRENDELALENVQVGIDGGNGLSGYYSMATNEEGEYAIGVFTSEEDSIKAVVNNPYLESINPTGYSIAEGGDNRDFGVYLTPDISDLSIEGYYYPAVRPGFDASIGVTYANIGSITTGGKIGIKLDPTFTFLAAIPTPDEIFGDSLVWNISEMNLLESEYLRVKVNVDVDAELGTVATSSLHFYNNLSDNNEEDNHFILSDTIVGSYDPNAKSVKPENGLTEVQIADKEELIYTVQFQNTGTYLAETVRITDQLDTALYLPSLRFIAASHDVSSFELKPGGLLEVTFNNINLADSLSNEPESHGFVSFAVQRNENFNADRAVKNTAAIFFDFNEPIFTNEVSFGVPIDTTSGEVAVRDISVDKLPDLIIYPNPAVSKFSIRSEEKLTGKGRVTIFDVNGKLVLLQKVADVSQPILIDLKEQAAGVFNILLETKERNLTGQVIVQK